MERWHFDLDQIRKNWERDADLPPNDLPAKFTRVKAPLDPYQEAHALLVRARGLARAELAAHETVLAPFFDECAAVIRRMELKPEERKEGSLEGKPEDRKALRVELERALGDLEDMLALFSGMGR